ncbi:hypothetical protein Pflav_077270 [Phytohabitans flavus]|uniref:Uncharacterized protein n=1 Tax=Phytohabitans flavus TaxID=1076124 RepID=A0A6F8Y5H7_9ACTN|nr:hypothetical protein Pflav_077270 [Phytohabitans flavus]
MVGYLQSLAYEVALEGVNSHVTKLPLAELQLCQPASYDPYILDHEFERSFPELSFRLTHLWTAMQSAIDTDTAAGASASAN